MPSSHTLSLIFLINEMRSIKKLITVVKRAIIELRIWRKNKEFFVWFSMLIMSKMISVSLKYVYKPFFT
jgi:hypothetical protein